VGRASAEIPRDRSHHCTAVRRGIDYISLDSSQLAANPRLRDGGLSSSRPGTGVAAFSRCRGYVLPSSTERVRAVSINGTWLKCLREVTHQAFGLGRPRRVPTPARGGGRIDWGLADDPHSRQWTTRGGGLPRDEDGIYRAFGLGVLTVTKAGIARIHVFSDGPDLVPKFDLPPSYPETAKPGTPCEC
jgi:hypothetical protein